MSLDLLIIVRVPLLVGSARLRQVWLENQVEPCADVRGRREKQQFLELQLVDGRRSPCYSWA